MSKEASSLTLLRCQKWQQRREPTDAAGKGSLPCEHFRERGRVREEAFSAHSMRSPR